MRDLHPLAVPAAVVAAFGLILAAMFAVEHVRPVGPAASVAAQTGDSHARARQGARPAAPAADENAGRKLEVRPEVFDGCYRALVEWKVDCGPLRREIKMARIKVKSADEQKMLNLFGDIASKLECKAYLVGIAEVNDRTYPAELAAFKKQGAEQMYLQHQNGKDAVAWIDRGLFVPSQEKFEQLQKELPGLQVIDGRYLHHPPIIKELETQIQGIEGAITVALSG